MSALTASDTETLETLREIEAFFRKEAAYECENMGSGGSTIALGRWKRFYTTLANVIQDLPELIAYDKERAALHTQREADAAEIARLKSALANSFADLREQVLQQSAAIAALREAMARPRDGSACNKIDCGQPHPTTAEGKK